MTASRAGQTTPASNLLVVENVAFFLTASLALAHVGDAIHRNIARIAFYFGLMLC